ncbi:MAG: hypothetical protein RL318_415 [Fibrobacterota bacterium]
MALLALGGELLAAPKPCLSISPFRASLAADSSGSQSQKRRLMDSLQRQLGEGWRVESAGNCPSSGPVLDLFQRPGDLLETQGSSLLRVRLEWRQASGVTLVTLEPQGRLQGDVSLWARTLAATIRTQMLVPVQVSADADDARVSGDLSGILPVSGLLPPGPMKLKVNAAGRRPSALDTLLLPGKPMQLDLHLTPLPSQGISKLHSKPSTLPRWISYGVGVVAASGAGWYAWRQQVAEERYRNLGANAAPGQFSNRWDDVRQANLVRNTLAGISLGTFGIGIALHFREASFLW